MVRNTKTGVRKKGKKRISWKRLLPIYIMMLPGLIYLIINNYLPMYGILIAFKKMNFSKGILGSPWAGLDNFRFLFASSDAWIITRNTVGYSLIFLVLGPTVSITFAILLNEVKNKFASRLHQSLILLPFLMSWVVVSYLAYAFLSAESGMFNGLFKSLGLDPINWYNTKKYWPFILVFFNTWKGAGYSMIVYLASIVGISQDYYEAAKLDGATKWQQIKKITLPLLSPTIITMLILGLGQIFRSDFGLFYQLPRGSGALTSVTRTLDVYIYQALMQNSDFGRSSAASFYQAIVGFVLIVAANAVVRKVSKESSLF